MTEKVNARTSERIEEATGISNCSLLTTQVNIRTAISPGNHIHVLIPPSIA